MKKTRIKDQMSSSQQRGSANRKLFVLFAVAFVVHLVLNQILNDNPTVIIDEGLYTNIARSLAWDGELAFRGQPVNYPYLLYPFLLVPVYRLNAMLGGDIYRYVQLFNTLLITASVFPAYLFAKEFTGNERTALTTALIVALMPDMVMGGFEMTEALIWLLTFWLICFAYRFHITYKLENGILTAVFTGLMFWAKPGAVTVGAVLLVTDLFLCLKRNKKASLQSIVPLAVLLSMVGIVYCIYMGLFQSESSILGLYEKQTSEWVAKDILVATEAFFLTVFLFVFACGGLFAILPFAYLNEYEGEKRSFILAYSAGVIVAILGTAVFVVPYRWDHSLGKLPLHMRYCAMFVPAFYVFSSALDLPPKKIGAGKGIKAAMIVFALLCVFPGARAGFIRGIPDLIDSVILSSFNYTSRINATLTGWFTTVIVLVFTAYFIGVICKGWKEKLKKACTGYLLILVLFNALCAHLNLNNKIDPEIALDASEVKQILGDDRALGITQQYYDDVYSYWLDGHLIYPMQQVTINQMFVEMRKSGGVYAPFIPVEQPPNVNNHETTDTDTIVLGMTIAEHLELSEHTSAKRTANGRFTIVTIKPGERWVDSMLSGLDDNKLYSGQKATLGFFDDSRNINGNLHLTINASGGGTLLIAGQELQLTEADTAYEMVLPYTEVIPIIAEGDTANITSYSTEHIS